MPGFTLRGQVGRKKSRDNGLNSDIIRGRNVEF